MISRAILAALLVCIFVFHDTAHAASEPVPATAIPFKREAAGMEHEFIRVAGALAVCGGLLAAGLYVFRRRFSVLRGPDRKPQLLRVAERQRLNSRDTLYVVEFG